MSQNLAQVAPLLFGAQATKISQHRTLFCCTDCAIKRGASTLMQLRMVSWNVSSLAGPLSQAECLLGSKCQAHIKKNRKSIRSKLFFLKAIHDYHNAIQGFLYSIGFTLARRRKKTFSLAKTSYHICDYYFTLRTVPEPWKSHIM